MARARGFGPISTWARGRLAALALVAAGTVGCKDVTPATVANEAADVAAPRKIVITRLSGRAENAQRSAIVVSDQGVVYCLDRPAWAESMVGSTVTVEGELETTVDFDAHGNVTGAQTSSGQALVFRTSTLIEQ